MDLKINNLKIKADIADTPEKRARGLIFSKKKKNMLFIYSDEKVRKFWMPFVKYPLTLYFINGQKKIMQIEKAIPMTADPLTWKAYKSEKPCKYVLEIPFDFKIKTGNKIIF